MNESARRSAFAYWVTNQRVADYNLRAATTRGLSVVVAAGVLLRASRVSWGAWLLLAAPAVAVYLVWTSARYVITGHMPREPFAAWGARISVETQGFMSVNLAGIVDGLGAVSLAVIGPWVLHASSTVLRLVAVGTAASWIASVSSATLVDVAWYNPAIKSAAILEMVRTFGGPIAGAILAAETLPAAWPGHAWLGAAAICGSIALVQLRVTETDRALRYGAIYADQRELTGRRQVTTALHTLLGNPLIHLKRQAKEVAPEIFDAVRQVEGGYRETLALDRGIDVTIDWPGVLISRLEAIAGQYGVPVTFAAPNEPMMMEDRELARFVLDDLTENAAKSGASAIAVTLARAGSGYTAEVVDDGPPFRPGTWLRAGGGLARLQHLLNSRGGSLQVSQSTSSKTVGGTWQAADTAIGR